MSAAIDTFFGNFGELTEEAEQIPQVRAFIVSALLHESLNAGAANEVANQVRRQNQEAAAHQAATPTARRKKPVPELTTEDLPPQLQDLPIQLFGRLDEIATIEKGLSPIQKTKPGPYPLVVTAEERGSSETFEFVGPAVAIPMVSSTGHGDASLKRIHYQEGEFAAGNILSVVKPICPQTINARFLYEYLTAFKEELLVARMSGTANVSLTVNKLREVPVPLVTGPALQKLDALMAQCDRLEAQLRERDTRQAELARAALARFSEAPTPENLDLLFHDSFTLTPADLRKTILTLAVQGKLVPQDPKDEPAESTLRAAGADIKKWRVSDDLKRFDVPAGWHWLRFAGVGEQRLGKMLDASKNRGNLKPYLRNTNVQWMRFELDDLKLMRIEEREEDEFRLVPGDLLICEGGEPGRCAIWQDQETEIYFQKALHRVRPCEAVLTEYLALNLQIDCQNDVLAGYFTGATIKHLTGRSLASYPIALPPLAEQRRIVAKVDQLMALVDEWEARLDQSRTAATRLLDALVAELTIHQTQ